jgi:hypothetical protein
MQTQLITWDVEKRYSEFYALHQTIQKRKAKSGGAALALMPKFPPKKIKNMNSEVIEERKESLSKYMNELAQVVNIFGDPDVRSFISMKDTEFM